MGQSAFIGCSARVEMKHESNHSGRGRRGLFVLLGAVAAVCGLTAATATRSEFQAFLDLATGASNHTMGFGSNGTPVATSGTGGATGYGNMNFTHTPGGPAAATG